MAKFLPGFLEGWPYLQSRPSSEWPGTITLSDSQIKEAVERLKEKKMTDSIDQLEALLAEHATAIQTIEGFVEEFAKRASSSVDPTRLQAILDRVKDHTSRLAALMAKFPLVK